MERYVFGYLEKRVRLKFMKIFETLKWYFGCITKNKTYIFLCELFHRNVIL